MKRCKIETVHCGSYLKPLYYDTVHKL